MVSMIKKLERMEFAILCLPIIFILSDPSYGNANVLRVRRMVGGSDAAEFEFPYQVSLMYHNMHICGGALVSDRHVLSAAHCTCGLIDEPFAELNVRIGSVYSKKGKRHSVKNVTCHPDYIYGPEASWVADLVVITLAEKIYVSASQSPITLAIHDAPVGERAVLSGWGKTHSSSSYVPEILQTLSLPIIDNVLCQKYYMNNTVLNSQVCTFEKKGIGACNGDSGSPLVYNGTLIAIFSWTYPCALGFPDVFTRITHFTDFIKQVIKNK